MEDSPVESQDTRVVQPLKVLVVDDQEGPREALKATIEEFGHKVSTADDGQEALELIQSLTFDLVLTDIMMPGIDGIEVLQKVRKVSPQTLVVLITGYGGLDSAISAIREGAYDYLTKPFREDELFVLMKNASERVRLLHENKLLIEELKKSCEQMKSSGAYQGEAAGEKNMKLLHALQKQLLQIYTRKDLFYPE